jgi:hypothetical protein
MVITMGNVITFVKMASANEYPVNPVKQSPDNEGQVDPSGTHHADKPDIGLIL